VKAGRGILPWFLSWTHVFTWSTSEVKEVWIKPLQPMPNIINAPLIICFMCEFFQECISIKIMEFPIKEILLHDEIVLQR
jgi:hypothetical protein